ncbi:hypothetical protein HLB42_20550 (plasmid) [Deinococcus sp. D7000]|nr:hypothetical protein HLB42_20550 [Deinococcus sp. D7000]
MTATPPQPMMAPVQNPHIIYPSAPLPEHMHARLRELGYAPHAAGLLMRGLPITYTREDRQIVEYPDGRRLWVKDEKEYDERGEFVRYRYDILGELPRAQR